MHLTVLGCVSSYRYPDAKTGPVRDVKSAAWKTHELGVKVSPHFQRAAFIEAFRSYGAVPFEAEAVPVRGRFVRVTVHEVPNSPGEQSWGMVAAATSFILPAYSDTSGYDVSFDTFIDGQPIHHYVYEARATTWAWAGLAPAGTGRFGTGNVVASDDELFSDPRAVPWRCSLRVAAGAGLARAERCPPRVAPEP